MSRFAFLLQSSTVNDKGPVFGKDVANAGLIRALGDLATPAEPLLLAVTDPVPPEAIAERFRIPADHLRLIRADRIDQAEIGCLLQGLPNIHHVAWQRPPSRARAYSLCGLIHTLAPPATQGTIARVLTAPIHPWDALICTSTALANGVRKLLDAWNEFYRERFNATHLPEIHLPVLPLGIHVDDFRHDPAHRVHMRAELGIAEDDIAVLSVGRLSFFEKMHPYATFAAMDLAARKTGRKLHLLMAGWFPHRDHEGEYRAMAARTCPSVTLHILDGTDSARTRQLWSAADLFTSLVDNVQETFGLAPVEAMAAGLPAVVSDWDVYRDTDAHGETGLRIGTLMPPAGNGLESLERHLAQTLSYQAHVGTVALATAIDIRGAGEALALLVSDADRRRQMGAAARQRAQLLFDWPKVAQAYLALMAELDERRQRLQPPIPAGNPMMMDPFELFSHYATLTMSDTDRLHILPGAEATLPQIMASPMNRFSQSMVASPAACRAILAELRSGPTSIGEIVARSPVDTAHCRRTIGWMIKLGLLALERPTR